jgi:putative peptidoglycan lipid II flippase
MAQSMQALRPTTARIARSAALVIGLLACAKLFSLFENWIALNRFGIGTAWDAYAAANKIPEQVFNLIAGGALAYAFIPIFGTFLTHDDREGAWRLASNVLNAVFVAALILSVIIFFAAPWLIANVVAPGFSSPYIDLSHPLDSSLIFAAFHPDRVMQTASLMRILLLSLLIFSVSGLCTGILHTNQRFLLPALAPILYDVGNVFGVLILARYFGIYGAAIGAVIGAGLHLGIQLPGLIRLRAKWLPILDWRDSALREVIVLMIPRAAGLALIQINMLVATNIASGLGAGSVAAFSRGWSLMQLPETLIGTAMGIVIFPTLAVLSSSGDLRGKRDAMSGALRFILIASIPAAVAMTIAGRPLIGVLEGGAFDAQGADRVFRVLQFFALAIVTNSAVEVVARAFYADKDTITPLWVALITATVNLALALILTSTLRVAGLALANSLAVGVELLTLIAILRRRWQGINESALIAAAVKATLAAAVMGLVMFGVSTFLNTLPLGAGRIISMMRTGVELAIGAAVYVAAALLLGLNELRELPRLFLKRRSTAVVAPAEVPAD